MYVDRLSVLISLKGPLSRCKLSLSLSHTHTHTHTHKCMHGFYETFRSSHFVRAFLVSSGTSIQSSQQENETKDGSLKSGGSQDESEEYLVILRRIANHISQPRKFVKASELMRRLLKELGEKESRSSSIQDGVLEVLRASMKDPGNVLDPAFAVEYSRLFSTAPSYLEVSIIQNADLLMLLRFSLRCRMSIARAKRDYEHCIVVHCIIDVKP